MTAWGLAVVAPWLPPAGHLVAVAVLPLAVLSRVRRRRPPAPLAHPPVDTGADLLPALAAALGRAGRLASVTIHTDDAEPVRWGRPVGLPTVVPLRHRGEHVGDLEVTGGPAPLDDLGPSLAGIRHGLQGARNLLAEHPEAGRELLAHLQAEVDLAVEATRDPGHRLRPPVPPECPPAGGPGLVGTGP